jgi:Rieske Fe-S protein
MGHDADRRTFLRWATHSLGALFAAILGIPAVTYLLDPRNRKGAPATMRPVDGLRISDFRERNGVRESTPRQGVIRDLRVDGWTLHPDDVVGRVWMVPADVPSGFRVFTTICPHLGCSVNIGEGCFACPCHNAQFAFADGTRMSPHINPALRGMDELQWDFDPEDRDRIRVRYQSFEAGVAEKRPIGGEPESPP